MPLFLGALLGGIAYAQSYEIQWSNFASLLIAGALVFAGFSMLWALVDLFSASRREYRPDGSLDRIDEFDYGRVKNSVKMPDGQNSERESITGDAAKLTLLLPLLSKNDQTAPKLEVRALTVTID